MLRRFLLSIGCVIAASGIYFAVLVLELYWNLYEWKPKWDLRATGMIITLVACITAMTFFTRAAKTRFTKALGGLLALVLLGLGVYVLPAEPLSPGLFGRSASSPGWYRVSRLAFMGMPLLVWLWTVLRERRASAERAAGRTGIGSVEPVSPARR